MAKEKIPYRKLLAVAQAEMERERDRFPRFPEPAAMVTAPNDWTISLEVEYGLGVVGAVIFRIKDDGEKYSPVVETGFLSGNRSGSEMVAFANLVQDLTRIAVGLQVLSNDYIVVEK